MKRSILPNFGGVLYTIGAILYSIKKIKFNHAIFHFFVLAGVLFFFIDLFIRLVKKKKLSNLILLLSV